MTWRACGCGECRGQREPPHALLTMHCQDTGDAFSVRVPWTARGDRAGWHGQEAVRWRGPDGGAKYGRQVAAGRAGVTVEDEAGERHRLDLGKFEAVPTPPNRPALHKALGIRVLRKALKPGQRWITVHPHGEGEHGVPVLISDNKDGTYSVVGGAGGKLQHLRLTQVRPKDKAAEKEAAKARTAKERERKAALTPEQKAAEGGAKTDVQAAKLRAEAEFVQKVRERMGGVSEDLDTEKLGGLSEGARNLVVTRHHKKQLREAQAVVETASKKLVEERTAGAQEEQAVRQRVDEDPVLAEHARELATTELELGDKEARERTEERRLRAQRVTGGDTKVGEKAAEKALGAIERAGDPTARLQKLGGRDDERAVLTVDRPASEEVLRRAAQSMADAKILAKTARGEEPANATERKIVDRALARAEVDAGDEGAAREALAREAARQYRRSHVQEARATRFQELEAEKGDLGAQQALAYSDMLGGIAGSAATAKRLGLTDTERMPLKEHEVAAMVDVLKTAAELREAQRQFREANKAAEAGDYARARQAFQVDVEKATDAATLSVEDQVRRELAESLRGMAARTRAPFMQAAAAGQFDAMADVGLAIGGTRYLDRSTVDALGPQNAAVLLRHALEGDGHASADVQRALEEHHVKSAEEISSKALAQAERYVPGLRAVVEEVGDIEGALKHLDVHEQDLDSAQEAVGAALGRMEATAALGETFRRKLPDSLELHTGGDVAGTLQWLHAVGLTEKGRDYSIDYGEKKVQVPRTAWDRLLHRLPAEEVERRNIARAIKAGAQDEQGWLPPGIRTRAASTFTGPTPAAPRSWTPLDLPGAGEAWGQHLEDHVGSRLADGEPPADVMSDLLSPVNVQSAADQGAYVESVRRLFPVLGEQGQQVKFEAQAEHFQKLAEDYQRRKFGDVTGALHAQDIGVDDPDTHEALFRALAEHPDAAHAFTPSGQIDHEGARSLRDYFYKRMGIDPKAKADDERFRQEMLKLGPRPDPRKGTTSLFGGADPTPEYRAWERERDELLGRYPRQALPQAEALLGPEPDPKKLQALREAAASAPTGWSRYVEAHGSLELAQRALQDEIRGRFTQSFRDHHARLTDRPLKLGVAPVTNQERHVQATAGEDELAALRAEAQSLYGKLRARIGGQFAAEGEGAVKAKFTRVLEQETINRQNQLGMFGARTVEPSGPPALRDPGRGERHTLGERAEQQIGSLMPQLGEGFRQGKTVGLFAGLNMDGARVHQQRVIKMLAANGGRLGGFLGTGSGKSLISIGAFTHEHEAGRAQHGLYLVPAAVQDQFGAEMLRYTEPGRYRWATGAGRDHEARVAMLKDQSTHMKVLTHEAFRDTMLRVVADHHHGGDVESAKMVLGDLPPAKRAEHLRAALDGAGIPRWFLYGDEAHRFTTRGEGETAGLHTVMSAASHPTNATHALLGTATPVKNDAHEAYSMAALLDPEHYGDRHEFLQNYGQNLAVNPEGIRRELGHLVYTARIDPEGVDRTDTDNPRIEQGSDGLFGGGPPRKVSTGGPLALHPEHQKLVDRVGEVYDRARKAREGGGANVEAIRELSPGQFAGQPPDEHEAIARRLAPSLGIIRESAMRRAVNQAPEGINTKLRALGEVVHHDLQHGTWHDRTGREQRGKPSIVFSDSLAEARLIHEHLSKQGVRAALYHGGLNAKEREGVRLGFQPEREGEPKHDVIVATSAAEAGLNLQRAKVVHHFDVPMTEKSHAQRSGRAYRQGQQGNVEVHNWHTDTDFEQQARRRLRRKGDLAAVFQSPFTHLDEHGIAGTYNRILAERHQAAEVA